MKRFKAQRRLPLKTTMPHIDIAKEYMEKHTLRKLTIQSLRDHHENVVGFNRYLDQKHGIF